MNRQTRSGFVNPIRSESPKPVKKRSKSRSASRTRKPDSRRAAEDKDWKSSSRKSPSRKSPSRKSPARKSPARKVVRDRISPSPSKIINKLKEKVADLRDSLTPDKRVEEVIRSSVTRFEEVASDFVSSVRRSNRLQSRENSIPVIDRFSTKTATGENNVHHQSDEPKGDRGRWFITLVLALALPAAVIAAQLACTKESCAPIPPKVTLTWRRFFDLEAAGWYLGYFVFQLILASLPLGFKNRSLGRGDDFNYCANGISILVISSAVLVGLEYYLKFPVVKILDRSLPILSTSILTSVIVSILLYVKAIRSKANRNEHGSTGSVISDWFAGAEINPRLGPLDVKTAMFRISLLSAIIYNSLLIFKEVQGKELEQISINVVLVAALQITFCLDFIVFESQLLSSFTVNCEGFGAWILLYFAIFPFFITLLPKYLYLSRSVHNIYRGSLTGVAFFIGFIIHRISNHQKAGFKRNTSSYSSSDIVHSRGSSLWKGGLWGRVRHPNYLGALIMHSSWSIFALASAPLHWIPPLLLATTLIEILVRISRVESSCQSRHGSAWNIYSSQVKHKLIHKVF